MARFARLLSLAAGLAVLSLFFAHGLPGDAALIALEESAQPLGSASAQTHASFMPSILSALVSTLVTCTPALFTAFLLAFVSARPTGLSRITTLLTRISAATPLILWVPFFSVLFPRAQAIAPFVLLAFHWWGPWHRLIRERLRETQSAPYVQAARARGLQGLRFYWRYRWRPIARACSAQMFTQAGHVLSGSILLEIAFRRPGLGALLFESVEHRDVPHIQATLFVITFLALLLQQLRRLK